MKKVVMLLQALKPEEELDRAKMSQKRKLRFPATPPKGSKIPTSNLSA